MKKRHCSLSPYFLALVSPLTRFQFSALQKTKENLYNNLKDFRKDHQTLNKKITVFLML